MRRAALVLVLTAAACSDEPPARARVAPAMEPAVAAKIDDAKRRAAADPSAAAFAHLGRVLHVHGLPQDAEAAYVSAAGRAEGGERVEALYLAAVAAEDSGDLEAARAHLVAALADGATIDRVHLRKAALDERLGDASAARLHYERAAALAPSSAASLGLGRLALADGDAAAALPHLERARSLVLGGDEAVVEEALARAYHRLGRADDAARAAERARAASAARALPIQADPWLARVKAEGVSFLRWTERAAASRRAGDLDAALRALDEALKIRPGSPDVLASRGETLLAKGRAADAEGDLREALHAAPGNRDARTDLARALHVQRRPAEAQEAIVQVLDASPCRRDAVLLLAEILTSRGRADESARYVTEALAAGADEEAARAALARVRR